MRAVGDAASPADLQAIASLNRYPDSWQDSVLQQRYEPLSRSKRALFSAVLVVGLALLVELFGLVAVLIREGEAVFWSGWRERRQAVILQFERDDRIGAAQEMRIPMGGDVLHPYLGAVADPSARPSVNPFGFYGEMPIRERSPSRIIVA